MSDLDHSWQIGLVRPGETSRKAIARRLDKRDDVEPGDLEALKACPNPPCGREACPNCRSQFRQCLCRESGRLGFYKGVWTRISIIPANMLFLPGTLTSDDVSRIIKGVQKKLERSPFSDAIAIGGLDVSLNSTDNVVEGFQGHIYVLVNRPWSPKLDHDIRAAFPPEPSAHKGYSITQVDPKGFFNALTYAYKNTFNRRSRYHEGRLKQDGSPRLNVTTQRLSGQLAGELDAALLPLRVGCRLILRNAHRVISEPTRFRLDLTVPLAGRSVP